MKPIHTPTGARVFAYTRGSGTDGRGRRSTKPRDEPEHRLHCQIAQYLTYALPPEIEWTYTANGAFVGHKQREKLASAGLRRGLGDYVLVVPARAAWTVCILEAKTHAGRLSDDQKRWAAKLGAKWATVETIEQVRDALVSWGVTPRVSIERANRYG